MLKNHPAPQFLLSIALLISSTLSSASPHNATHRPGVPNPRLIGTDEDYNNLYEETTEMTHIPRGSPSPPCQYDPCKDQQESCHKLALALSCSCPGISSPRVHPDPPFVKSLLLESNGMVVVRWCAPSSTVTRYLIQVEGEDRAREAEENRRMMELGDVAPGTEVCVEAMNKVGISRRESHSCTRFEAGSSEAGSSETRLTIKLAFISAAVVLVVAVLLALLLWWCKRHGKSTTRTANRGTDVVL